jgi:hypothetical protein
MNLIDKFNQIASPQNILVADFEELYRGRSLVALEQTWNYYKMLHPIEQAEIRNSQQMFRSFLGSVENFSPSGTNEHVGKLTLIAEINTHFQYLSEDNN